MPHRPRTPIRWLAALGQTALAAAHALAESVSDMQSSPQQAVWQRLDLSVFVHRRQHRPRRPVAAGHRPEQARPADRADVKCLEEMGQALQARYGAERTLVRGRLKAGDAIAAAVDGDRDTFWTAPAGSQHATLELQFKQPLPFDPAMAAEWRNDGQLVRKYAKCCATGSGKAAQGIGHMKIDHFPAVTALHVRLNVLSSADAAHIRKFELFNIGKGAAAR